MTGAAFSFVRRLTGVLVAAMLLHGLMDFSILVSAAATGVTATIATLFTIAAAIVVFRHARSATPAEPPGEAT